MGERRLRLFIVAGEESGDQLGAALMMALRQRTQTELVFEGIGGKAMGEAGLRSLFDMNEIAVMGFSAVIPRLAKILARIDQTARAAIAARPDALIIIDSPDFTHRVARKVKRALPEVPVLDYVCPSVWAWRPGRAKKMTAYIDHVLAILPFEPQVLRALNGPPATYVGHPLLSSFINEPRKTEKGERKTLLLLPGSRQGEISRLLPVFEETVKLLSARRDDIDFMLLAVERFLPVVQDRVAGWPVRIQVVAGETQKRAVFQRAHAALAASGTICLELALANTPMISTYKLDPIARRLRFLVSSWSANLPNLIVDYPFVPEYIDEFVRPATLCRGLERLLDESAQRESQLAGFQDLRKIMQCGEEGASEQKAADMVLNIINAEQK